MAEVTRPNGKVYRPRKEPSLNSYSNQYEEEWPIVMRTHDIDLALDMVRGRVEGQSGSYYDWCRGGARLRWARLIPTSHGAMYDRTWIDDPVRGVPCVFFEDCPRDCEHHHG